MKRHLLLFVSLVLMSLSARSAPLNSEAESSKSKPTATLSGYTDVIKDSEKTYRSFSCVASFGKKSTDHKTTSVQWFIGEQPLETYPDIKSKPKPSTVDASLDITEIPEHLRNEHIHCKVTSKDGMTAVSQDLSLSGDHPVVRTFSYQSHLENSLGLTPQTRTVTTPYGMASFLCYPSVGDVSQVTWYKNGKEIHPEQLESVESQFIESTLSNFGSLVFKNIQPEDDDARITCTARSENNKKLMSNTTVLQLQDTLDAPNNPKFQYNSNVISHLLDYLGNIDSNDPSVQFFFQKIINNYCSADDVSQSSPIVDTQLLWDAPAHLEFAIAAPSVAYCVSVADLNRVNLKEAHTREEKLDAINELTAGSGLYGYNYVHKDALIYHQCQIESPKTSIPLHFRDIACGDLVARIVPVNLAGLGTPRDAPLQHYKIYPHSVTIPNRSLETSFNVHFYFSQLGFRHIQHFDIKLNADQLFMK